MYISQFCVNKKENLKYYAEFDGKQAQYYAECHCLSLMQLLQLLW